MVSNWHTILGWSSYSGDSRNPITGKMPTSHCIANTVRKAIGFMSGTKARTTPRPTVCIATTKNASPPSRIPRSRGGEIFQCQPLYCYKDVSCNTSDAYVVPTARRPPTAKPLIIFPAKSSPLLVETYCTATPTIWRRRKVSHIATG